MNTYVCNGTSKPSMLIKCTDPIVASIVEVCVFLLNAMVIINPPTVLSINARLFAIGALYFAVHL